MVTVFPNNIQIVLVIVVQKPGSYYEPPWMHQEIYEASGVSYSLAMDNQTSLSKNYLWRERKGERHIQQSIFLLIHV